MKVFFVRLCIFLLLFLFYSHISISKVHADFTTGADWIGLYPADVPLDSDDNFIAAGNCLGVISLTCSSASFGAVYGQGFIPALESSPPSYLPGVWKGATVPITHGAYEFRYNVNNTANIFNWIDTSGNRNYGTSSVFWSRMTLTAVPNCSTQSVVLTWGPLLGVSNVWIYRDGVYVHTSFGSDTGWSDPSPTLGLHAYSIELHAGNNIDVFSSINDPVFPSTLIANATVATCPPTFGPNALQLINNPGAKTVSGQFGFSGTQNGTNPAPSVVQGKGWYNGMTLHLNTILGNDLNPKRYILFYTGATLPITTTFTSEAQLENIVSTPNKGFLLRCDPVGTGNNDFYVMDKLGDFKEISSNPVNVNDPVTGNLIYQFQPDITKPHCGVPNSGQTDDYVSVLFSSAAKSSVFNTGIYAVDNTNASSFVGDQCSPVTKCK